MRAVSQVQVSITAALESAFTQSFGKGEKVVNSFAAANAKLSARMGDIAAFRRQQNAVRELGGAWQAARGRVDALQAAINKAGPGRLSAEFKRATETTRAANQAWTEAKSKVEQLAAAIRSTERPTKAQRQELRAAKAEAKSAGVEYQRLAGELRAFDKAAGASDRAVQQNTNAMKRAKAEVRRTGEAFTSARTKLSEMSRALEASGTDVARLSQSYRGLKSELAAVGQQQQRLAALQRRVDRESIQRQHRLEDVLRRRRIEEERVAAAQARRQATMDRVDRVAGGVAGAAGAFVAGKYVAGVVGSPLITGAKEARSYETETARIDALGMGDHVTKEAVAFAKSIKMAGTSMVDNLTLMRDTLSVFSDVHHAEMATPVLAKMKFANEAFFGQARGEENERAFMDMLKVIELRGGTKSKEDFMKQANMVQQVISATGGRVGGEEWRHVIARGGLAAQSMRDDAFFYQLEPLVQMMSGNNVGTGLAAAYQALYQGKTTKRAKINLDRLGLIADRSKVEEDKAGQIAHINPGALLGADVFRQSQYEWVKTVLVPQLAKHGITSREDIEDTIGSIVSNPRGANMLVKMFDQQQLIDKDEKRNRGAFNIDQLDARGRQMTAGKELIARKRMEDAEMRLGQEVMPAYTRAVEAATSVLEAFNKAVDSAPIVATTAAWGLAVTAAVAAIGTVATGLRLLGGLLGGLTGGGAAAAGAGAGAAGAAGAAGGAAAATRTLAGTVARAAGPAAAITAVANFTSAGEDKTIADAVTREKGQMAALRAKYGQATLDAAFSSEAPWMNRLFGLDSARPEDVDAWTQSYLKKQKPAAAAPSFSKTGGAPWAPVTGLGAPMLGLGQADAPAAANTATAAQAAATAAQEAARAATIKPNVQQTFQTTLSVTVNEAQDGQNTVATIRRELDKISRDQAAKARASYMGQPGY